MNKRSLAAIALAAALAAPLPSAAQYCGQGQQVCDECARRTLGHVFLNLLNARLNEGVLGADYHEPVPGLLLRIDYSGAPPPEGAFLKYPDAWPIRGADQFNRVPIEPAEFSDTLGWNEANVGVRVRLHNFQNDAIELGFNCNPVKFGGALTDGAFEIVTLIRADGSRNLLIAGTLHIEFSIPEYCTPDIDVPEICTPEICTPRICVFGHCTRRYCIPAFCTPAFTIPGICTPAISFSATLTSPDVGLDITDFHLWANLVPHVSTDGSSVDLALYTDLSQISEQLAQHVTNAAAVLTAGITAGVCGLTPLEVVCSPIAAPIAWAIVEYTAENAIQRLVDEKLQKEVQKKFAPVNDPPHRECEVDATVCTCGSTCELDSEINRHVCKYPSPGNQWIRTAQCKFAEKVDSLHLPERILDLAVPNFDEVVPFDPPYAPSCQP